jgi:predicted nucleotidyltransferase
MNDIENNVADSIAVWAAENPEVRRVWVFGSRAKGTHRPDSDIDIAVELEPVGDSEETLVRWIAHSTQWEAQLQSRIAAKIDLEWFDPDGSTRRVQAALSEGKGLMYERTS